MPTHEDVEEFFLDFARDMRDQGLFIMDDYKHDWPNLMTRDEVRTMLADLQSYEDEDDEEINQNH